MLPYDFFLFWKRGCTRQFVEGDWGLTSIILLNMYEGDVQMLRSSIALYRANLKAKK